MQTTAIYRRKIPERGDDLDDWIRHHEVLDAIERARPELWPDRVLRYVATGAILCWGFLSGLVLWSKVFGGI